MDLDSLHLFVDVVRRGSFASVARDRGLDPSSVSRSIARLEDGLGVRLLHRTTRRLTPTEAGTAFVSRVGPLVDELTQAAAEALDAGHQPTGVLRIAAPVSFSELNVVPLLPLFAARYPDLSFDLMLTDRTVDLVGERVDVAIRLGALADATTVAQRLTPMIARACASPDYIARRGRPRTPADLAEHDGLHLDVASFTDRWRFEDADGHTLTVHAPARVRTSNAVALKALAIAGMGVVLQARWSIGRELHRGALVDLFPDYTATAALGEAPAAWVVYPTRTYVPRKVRVFVDFLREQFAGGPPWDTNLPAKR